MSASPEPGRLTLLGGSSPFTTVLFDALAASDGQVAPRELVLHGRDERALASVTRYAQHRLEEAGWVVRATVQLDAALHGAALVLHQIRYGDLAGRSADEGVAEALGVPADETLGPAGLAAAVRITPGVQATAGAVRERCPNALVVNLTNPLSIATSLLHDAGCRVVGLCELPAHAAAAACAVLGVDAEEVDWAYAGLNHRGVVYGISRDGEDLMGRLPTALGDATLDGITAREIEGLGALPVKHFALLRPDAPVGSGRAAALAGMRERALTELEADASRVPPSVLARDQPWYAEAVVPLLRALGSFDAQGMVLDLPESDGITRERRVWLSARTLTPTPAPPVPAAAAAWLDRCEHHERLALAAAREPTEARLRAALAADPLLPPAALDRAVALLVQVAHRRAAA